MLESGQEEILLTSLLVEKFTGNNKIAIEQNFYASIYIIR